MSKKVAEIQSFYTVDTPSQWIANLWTEYNNQRRGKIEEWERTP